MLRIVNNLILKHQSNLNLLFSFLNVCGFIQLKKQPPEEKSWLTHYSAAYEINIYVCVYICVQYIVVCCIHIALNKI